MLRSAALAVLAVLATLLLAAPASAAPPRSAEEIVRVLERAQVRVDAESKGLAPRVDRALAPCFEVLTTTGRKVKDEEVGFDLFALTMHALFEEAFFKPLLPVYAQVSRELDAIPTADRALRQGRAVWRKAYDTLLRIERVPDACARLQRWSAAGFAPAARPRIPKLDVLDVAMEDTKADDAKLARAVRRLRALGIGPRRARLIDGESLVAGLEKELDEIDFEGFARDER